MAYPVRAICSSSASEAAARKYNIPITDFDAHPVIDLAVDGADQIAPGLALIKGGGGQLLREKIVGKRHETLRRHRRFQQTRPATRRRCGSGRSHSNGQAVGSCQAARARVFNPNSGPAKDNSEPYVTDEGNWILDSWTEPIADLERLSRQIREIIGVVEHGLFVNMASLAVISDGESVWELDRISATNLFERTPLPAPGK